MTDSEIIDRVAEYWISLGGDSDGLCYCWSRLLDRIREIEQERDTDR